MNHDRVLATYPNHSGFGWVLFEGPDKASDWGIVRVPSPRNEKCVRRIANLLTKLRPDCLVLEASSGPGSRRSHRVRRLCRSIVELGERLDTKTLLITRAQIRACFEGAGAKSRHEIAGDIAARMDEIAHLYPPRRKIWRPEDPRMGLFNAAAVAITHYWLAGQG